MLEKISEILRKELGISAIWHFLYEGVYPRMDKLEKRIEELEQRIVVYEKVLEISKGK